MTRRTLDDDLRDLERTDPAVRDAVRKYDAVVAKITGRTLDDRERVLSAMYWLGRGVRRLAGIDPFPERSN